MPAKKTTTLALIGCGLWGRNILRDLIDLDCRVIVVDPDLTQRAKAESLGAIQTLERIDSLPDVDGLVVAAPATTHTEVLEQVLDRNSPVFCEKPLTTDPAEAHKLSLRAGGNLFVMHIWRYHPAVQELARIVATGELGSVHMLRTIRTNWTSPRTDTDSIWTLVPHNLTIALAVLGDIPEPRYALAEVIDGRPVGLIAALGDMPHFVLEASTRYADKRREIRLHCSEGVAIFPGHESGSVLICRGTGLEPETEIRRFDNTPPLRRELEVFVEHLHGGPAPPTGADEGAAVVEMIVRLRELAGLQHSA